MAKSRADEHYWKAYAKNEKMGKIMKKWAKL
jgi:hypothetical protein